MMLSTKQIAEEKELLTPPFLLKRDLCRWSRNPLISLREELLKLTNKLKGIADLHAHPASHLAFGFGGGEGGMFWGSPGLFHTDSPEKDLPACACDKHSGFTADLIRHQSRVQVLSGIHKKAESYGWCHESFGYPTYSSWPAALSTTHQQMHISWIYRAWRAGLRLLVASVTDNQVLHILWNRYYAAPSPAYDPSFDYNSALRQLAFIKSLANANSGWMQIVTTAAEARSTICAGKLAVVLAVEMDKLTVGQVQVLVMDEGVRLVTPVHIVDNDFGGASIYDDIFNTANLFLNGKFFDIVHDLTIGFSLAPSQQVLKYVSPEHPLDASGAAQWGALVPYTVSYPPYYPQYAGMLPYGHKNAVGLKSIDSWKRLMNMRLLIDVAHMSELCTEAVIKVAEQHNYPLLNTHGGVRSSTEPRTASERNLRRDHAERISKLGGLIGLGTGYQHTTQPIKFWQELYRDLLICTNGVSAGLGTDMNGLDISLANSEVTVPDQFSIPGQVNEVFTPLSLGVKTFNFAKDGLAHYGMLPDFLYALSKSDSSGEVIRNLYSSADAFVHTWELVEQYSPT